MSNILTLTLKTGLLLSLRFLKILRGIRTLHVMTKGSIQKRRCNNYKYIPNIGFPRGLVSKEPACWRRRRRRFGFDPWSGRFLAEGMGTHSSILEGRITMDRQRRLAGYSPSSCKKLGTD